MNSDLPVQVESRSSELDMHQISETHIEDILTEKIRFGTLLPAVRTKCKAVNSEHKYKNLINPNISTKNNPHQIQTEKAYYWKAQCPLVDGISLTCLCRLVAMAQSGWVEFNALFNTGLVSWTSIGLNLGLYSTVNRHSPLKGPISSHHSVLSVQV